MSELQVLVATMHQRDFSLVEKMNICCDAVIANQADRNSFDALDTACGRAVMITTDTRGVGLNRNIALLAADAELLLFADDDMVYYDDMPRTVCDAFRENPKADVIVFGIDIVKNGVITEHRQNKPAKLHVWNSMKYGAVRIAVRRSALLKTNVQFSQLFGGGCMYSAGEDSLFLKACFDAGLKVYSHEYVLGTCCKDTSTWFTGYGEKYFYDKGALVRQLFPKTCCLMAPYFAIRFKRETEVPVMKRLKLVYRGLHGSKNLQPYQE